MSSACCATPTSPQRASNSETRSTPHSSSTNAAGYFSPAVDVAETDEAFLVTLDIPGASSESVHVDFEKGLLTVKAQIAPRARQGARALLTEYRVGNYYRSFRIGESIDVSSIGAELSNGVLSVRLPKIPEAKARRIQVSLA